MICRRTALKNAFSEEVDLGVVDHIYYLDGDNLSIKDGDWSSEIKPIWRSFSSERSVDMIKINRSDSFLIDTADAYEPVLRSSLGDSRFFPKAVIKSFMLKKQTPTSSRGFQTLSRRKRDSNPRRCDPQQFSRLPHSTTLPFLLKGDKYTLLFSIRKHFINSLLR